jgi:hypothetical protein
MGKAAEPPSPNAGKKMPGCSVPREKLAAGYRQERITSAHRNGHYR